MPESTTADPVSTPVDRKNDEEAEEHNARADGSIRLGHDCFCLTFPGGLFDTIMQIGVIHALLVARRRPPDVVGGISMGAVNSVILAEVMQEPTPERRVARLRTFIQAYLDAPREVYKSLLPDTNEVKARAPLRSIDFPIYPKEEREKRDESVRSVYGFIKAVNDALGLRLRVSDLTKLVHAALQFASAGAYDAPFAWRRRAVASLSIWLLLILNLWRLRSILTRWLSEEPTLFPQGIDAGDMISGIRNGLSNIVRFGISLVIMWACYFLLFAAGGVVLLSMLITGFAIYGVIFSPAIVWAWNVFTGMAPISWSTVGFMVLQVLVIAVTTTMRLSPSWPRLWLNQALNKILLCVWCVLVVFLPIAAGWLFVGPLRPSEAMWWFNMGNEWIWLHRLLIASIAVTCLAIWNFILDQLIRRPGMRVFVLARQSFTKRRKEKLEQVIEQAKQSATLRVVYMCFTWAASVSIRVILPSAIIYVGYIICAAAPRVVWFICILVLLAVLGIGCLLYINRKTHRGSLIVRYAYRLLLAKYDLHNQLGNSYSLKQMIIRLIDPEYYGKPNLQDVVTNALLENGSARTGNANPKRMSSYRKHTSHPIHVLPIVTRLTDGNVGVVHKDEPVVDGLLAATAAAPYMKPVPVRFVPGEEKNDTIKPSKTFCLDAININNEPMLAVLDHFRSYLRPVGPSGIKNLYVFPIAPFPTGGDLPGGKEAYDRLTDVVERVWDLNQYQTAKLERKLVKLYTRLLSPAGSAIQGPEPRPYIRASVIPVDADSLLKTNQALSNATDESGRQCVMYEGIAAGCRSMMQVFNAKSLTADRTSCVSTLKTTRGDLNLPGNGHSLGPGLAEVCRHCTLGNTGLAEDRNLLARPANCDDIPEWPFEDNCQPDILAGSTTGENPNGELKVDENSCEEASDDPRKLESSTETPNSSNINCVEDVVPWITLLLSGGVFRGVFQVGVINGLVQLNARPKLYAGASVGSIMCAMACRILSNLSFCGPTVQYQKERAEYLAQEVAATFLGLDRLVLTDRLADFVRKFTIRAGDTKISLRDLDHAIRRYDDEGNNPYLRDLRQCIAGIERLLYLPPHQLAHLLRVIREGNHPEAYRAARDLVHVCLESYELQLEVLGAEPLRFLIEQHVLKNMNFGKPSEHVTIQDFAKRHDSHILMMTTALKQGRLVVLGEPMSHRPEWLDAKLVQGLLASSAFPAVFRPRFSFEMFEDQNQTGQFVDGGVMSNVPLDSMCVYLHEAATSSLLLKRPDSHLPHLIVAGSLEPTVQFDISESDLANDWVAVMSRSRKFSYNRKLDIFKEAQAEFDHLAQSLPFESPRQPLYLKLLPVKPNWLCGTFAFHPMLGFRREKQAESIAHGCAATLATVYKAIQDVRAAHSGLGYRQISLNVDPDSVKHWERDKKLRPQPGIDGECWFQRQPSDGGRRPVCPFSRQATKENPELTDTQRSALAQIYQLCGETTTHDMRT